MFNILSLGVLEQGRHINGEAIQQPRGGRVAAGERTEFDNFGLGAGPLFVAVR